MAAPAGTYSAFEVNCLNLTFVKPRWRRFRPDNTRLVVLMSDKTADLGIQDVTRSRMSLDRSLSDISAWLANVDIRLASTR